MGTEQSVVATRHSDGSINTMTSEAFLKLSPKMSLVYKRVMSSLENKRSIQSPSGRMRRAHSMDSTDEWGFFEDFEPSPLNNRTDKGEEVHEEDQSIQRALSLPPPATSAPMYVLESTLATQQLWYSTAGLRPKQPQQEREYFENLWERNFQNSDVPDNNFDVPSIINEAAPKKTIVKDEVPFKEYDGEILFRGKGPFSNSVSKSFSDHDVAAMTLQIPRFRIVRTSNGVVHAEFLVVVSIGSHSTVTFGLWRRHSDFNKLAMKVPCTYIYSNGFMMESMFITFLFSNILR